MEPKEIKRQIGKLIDDKEKFLKEYDKKIKNLRSRCAHGKQEYDNIEMGYFCEICGEDLN